MNRSPFRLFILFLVFATSCSDNNISTEVSVLDVSQPWVYSSPQAEGIVNLNTVKAHGEEALRLTSVTVVRNGRIVLEEYFKGYKKDSLHDVRSVTKSVVGLLLGLAIQEGFIQSVDDPISKYLSSERFTLTEAEQAITIDNLLTMSSGFEWHENDGNAYNEWASSNQPVQFLLEKPLVTTPGSLFNYNSAAVHLLGVIISEASQMTLPKFADKYLFNRMGITNVQWEQIDDQNVNGGSGIQLLPEDMARIGQLILQKGFSGSQVIVPQSWIDKITEPSYTWRNTYGALIDYTYGRLWWVQDGSMNAIFAWGWGGQYIYVVPELKLVVVTTTNWINARPIGAPASTEKQALSLIVNDILPQVK